MEEEELMNDAEKGNEVVSKLGIKVESESDKTEDNDNNYYNEPPGILRKYNYKLETGIVGTDDDNIASVLYTINRMEMKAEYSSYDAENMDEEEMDEALGELFFMVVDAKVHINRFLEVFGNKVKNKIVQKVITTLDDAIQIVREHRKLNENEIEQMAKAFPEVYKKLLDLVPIILALDAQTVGRV